MHLLPVPVSLFQAPAAVPFATREKETIRLAQLIQRCGFLCCAAARSWQARAVGAGATGH